MVLFLFRMCFICNVEIIDLLIYNLFCDLFFQDFLYLECWKEFEESGILRMIFVDYVFVDVIQNGFFKEDILDMMELYGLIVKFFFFLVVFKNEQKYFVLVQLRLFLVGLCEIKIFSGDLCFLYFYFFDGFVFYGLFFQFLVRFICWFLEYVFN